jgi:hypothetical protein
VIIISLPSKVGLTPQSRLHLADPLQRVALLYNFYKHFEQILARIIREDRSEGVSGDMASPRRLLSA